MDSIRPAGPIEQHKEMMFYVERMGIERIISVDIGGTLQDPLLPKPHDREQVPFWKKGKEKTPATIISTDVFILSTVLIFIAIN